MHSLLFVLACAHDPAPSPAPPPVAEPSGAPVPVATAPPADSGVLPVEEPAPPPVPPSSLPSPARDPGFAMPLLARIEGPSSADECKVDTDCAMAGCSHEVCVAAGNATHIVTTCEMLPLFEELKACTCQAGLCQWVHEPGARGGARPMPMLRPQ